MVPSLVHQDQGRIGKADPIGLQQRLEVVDHGPARLDHGGARHVAVGRRYPLGLPGLGRDGFPVLDQLPAAIDPEPGHGRPFGGGRLGHAVDVAPGDLDHPGFDAGLVQVRTARS